MREAMSEHRQMEAWVLDTRNVRAGVVGHTTADNRATLEKAIRVLRVTYPEPHFVIVTPEADLAALREAAQAVVEAVPSMPGGSLAEVFTAIGALRAVLASADSAAGGASPEPTGPSRPPA